MLSLKLVDTQNVAIGGRADAWWKKNYHKLDAKFLRFRRPPFIFPKELNDGKITDQQRVLQYFDLKGFEYGNWLNNNERYNFLIGCVYSLLDLEKVIGIKKIGFKKISIAFGARGRKGAAAHFETNTFAINLTKEYGVNSLAHEYGHALDCFFGTFIDQDKDFRYLSGGKSPGSIQGKKIVARKNTLRYYMQDLLHVIAYDENGALSDYYKRLKKNSIGGYWIASTEIFARTFEQYIQYQLQQKGIVNAYLAKKKYENWMYLKPSEFKAVLSKMKRLINAMAKAAK